MTGTCIWYRGSIMEGGVWKPLASPWYPDMQVLQTLTKGWKCSNPSCILECHHSWNKAPWPRRVWLELFISWIWVTKRRQVCSWESHPNPITGVWRQAALRQGAGHTPARQAGQDSDEGCQPMRKKLIKSEMTVKINTRKFPYVFLWLLIHEQPTPTLSEKH